MTDPDSVDSEHLWSRFILQLNRQHPFFAGLALHAELQLDENHSFALTQDRNLFVGTSFLAQYDQLEQFSFLLHQLLHLALAHNSRGRYRCKETWNVAADIVVNDIISHMTQWPVAPQTAWDKRYHNQSVEAVYRDLLRKPGSNRQTAQHSQSDVAVLQTAASQADQANRTGPADLQKILSPGSNGCNKDLESNPGSEAGSGADADGRKTLQRYGSQVDLPLSVDGPGAAEQVVTHWRHALQGARQLAERRNEFSSQPAALKIECATALQSQVDWRTLLWRYICQTQDDYTEFDRRFIHQGLYVEALQTESLHIAVIIDTSGSINSAELGQFTRELQSISALYPQTRLVTYYADADVYGPYNSIGALSQVPSPKGGGGTSFSPALKAADSSITPYELIIYFTDGFGEFPEIPTRRPVLWVLTELGAERHTLPFGQSIRLSTEEPL